MIEGLIKSQSAARLPGKAKLVLFRANGSSATRIRGLIRACGAEINPHTPRIRSKPKHHRTKRSLVADATMPLHTFDHWQSCKSAAIPVRQLSSPRCSRPDLKRSPWSVTCLSPTQRQGELLATQNPDGSLVFSAVLDEDQGLLSFVLIPPSAKRTPQRQRYARSPNS
jgi:hypothetical protein